MILGLTCSLSGEEEAQFKTAKPPKPGESTGFDLTKSSKVILNDEDGKYVVLELVSSNTDGGDKGHTESCSISWTSIEKKSVKTGVSHAFIKYTSEAMKDGSSMLTQVGGSDAINVGGIKIRWSYGAADTVYLYPSPNTRYATIKAEQDGAE